jgi:hypothetical protein
MKKLPSKKFHCLFLVGENSIISSNFNQVQRAELNIIHRVDYQAFIEFRILLKRKGLSEKIEPVHQNITAV